MRKNYDENPSIANPLQVAYDEREDVSPPSRLCSEELAWRRHLAAEQADVDRRVASGDLVIEW